MDSPVAVTEAPLEDAHAAPPNLMAWIGLGILVLLAFVSFLDRQIIALMVSPIERDLHITDTQIGLLQGPAFGLVYPIFAIPLGYAADRYTRRWVIFWSVTLWALSAMASGLANSFDALFAARVGVGLGEAAVGPATASLLSNIFPKHRLATVFSVYGAGSMLGSAGALAIGGAVITWAGPGMEFPVLGHLEAWQIAFIVTGAPALVLAFLIFMVPEKPRPKGAQNKVSAADWSEVFAFIRRTWAYLLCYVVAQTLLTLVGWGAWTWQPAVMERTYGMSAAAVGSALGIFTLAFGLTGQLTNGVVVDRIFTRRADAHLLYYVVGAVIVTVTGCLAPLAPGPLLYLLALGPMKFILNFGGVFTAALQIVTPSRLRGRMTALTSIVVGLAGFSLGPWVVPFFTENVFHDPSKVNWATALMIGIFVPLAGIFLFFGMKPMRAAVELERGKA